MHGGFRKPVFFPSHQALFGASEEQLPHPLGGVHRHRDPPGSLPPGVPEAQQHLLLPGRHGSGGQLHARAGVHAEQRLEEEAENFGEVATWCLMTPAVDSIKNTKVLKY